MMRACILSVCLLWFFTSCDQETPQWTIRLHQSEGEQVAVKTFELGEVISDQYLELDGYQVRIEMTPKKHYTVLKVNVMSPAEREVFVSLDMELPGGSSMHNFNEFVPSKEMYRQCPHDLNAWIVESIPMQAVPMIGAFYSEAFVGAVSNSPFHYENFTSQAFFPEKGFMSLRSGDDGTSPGVKPQPYDTLDLNYNTEKTQYFTTGRVIPFYHTVSKEKRHEFEAILFQSEDIEGLSDIRQIVNTYAAHHFSGGEINDYFGALSFTTAYMNLRKNESLKSEQWVIPAVEYGNTQYGRDAFWISMVLPDEYAAECLQNELIQVNHFAEYPLFAIIWAYRSYLGGQSVNLNLVQDYVNAVEDRVEDHQFYSYYEGDGRLDFQYWGDLMAFERHDVIAYNQGLFAVALGVAEKMGLQITNNPEKAISRYRALFDEELGFMPVSELKPILSPDAIIPDLLSQLYLGRPLLSSDMVIAHFDRMVDYAKTEHGFKVVSTPTGEYLPTAAYDIPDYLSQVSRGDWVDGEYFRGGSYFLYDNLFLMTAYLHGVDQAESLLNWRVSLDFEKGGTTFEHINTLTGVPHKPNMGWNVAVYALWKQLVKEGKATTELFESIDQKMLQL